MELWTHGFHQWPFSCGHFLFVGIRLWAFGKKHVVYYRIQFSEPDSNRTQWVLVVRYSLAGYSYLLIGIIGAGKTIEPVTAGAFQLYLQTQPLRNGLVEYHHGLQE